MNFSFRKDTNDSLIYESIFIYDEYKLPDRFLETDVIVDIGAHVGFFTYAAAQRGTRNVYAFEPDQENYEIALKHLKDYIAEQSVYLIRRAVWRSDLSQKELVYSGYYRDDNYVNTGSGNVLWRKKGVLVPAISFDEVVLGITKNGRKRIRLLKLDCEGSEWPILFTSKTLHLIDEICGEFHEIGGAYDIHTAPFSIKGFERFTIDQLIEFFEKKGFFITYSRRLNTDCTLRDGGIFIATNMVSKSEKKDTPLHSSNNLYFPLLRGASVPQRNWVEQVNAEERASLKALTEYVGWVRYVAYSFNGSKILINGSNGTLGLWDTENGQLLTFLDHTGVLVNAAFSKDGNRIMAGLSDWVVRLWDAGSGRLLTTLDNHTSWLVGAAFSVDGNKGFTVSHDGMVRIWDTTNGRLLAAYECYTEVVMGAAFSPDRSKGIAGSCNGIVWLWKTENGRILTTLDGHTDTVISMVFSQDGSKVVTGSYDKTARIWDVNTGCLLATLEGHAGAIRSIAFSQDDSKIITGSYDKTARIWDVNTGCLLATLEGHTDRLVSVAFLADGSKGLTISYDGSVRLWETAGGRLLALNKDKI